MDLRAEQAATDCGVEDQVVAVRKAKFRRAGWMAIHLAFDYVADMKHTASIIILALLLVHPAWSGEGWRLDLAYFDAAGGALAPTDGCIGQVIEDVDGKGATSPLEDGRPGVGDRLLIADDERDVQIVSFRTNGGERLEESGFFWVTLAGHAGELPERRVFLRVWNSMDFSTATGYWDSPMFRVLGGLQQVSFLRSEWAYREIASGSEPMADGFSANSEGDPVLAEDSQMLTTWPNPFNSTARVRLSLTQPEHVRLRVFDIQGRIMSILTESALAAGDHDLIVDGARWPTGLYFLSAEIGGERTIAQRLLLIR